MKSTRAADAQGSQPILLFVGFSDDVGDSLCQPLVLPNGLNGLVDGIADDHGRGVHPVGSLQIQGKVPELGGKVLGRPGVARMTGGGSTARTVEPPPQVVGSTEGCLYVVH